MSPPTNERRAGTRQAQLAEASGSACDADRLVADRMVACGSATIHEATGRRGLMHWIHLMVGPRSPAARSRRSCRRGTTWRSTSVWSAALRGRGSAPPSLAARGVCARGTVKRRALSLQEPVGIGGVLVRPGDWVLGDHDGCVCVPAEKSLSVLHLAEQREVREEALRQGAKLGEPLLGTAPPPR